MTLLFLSRHGLRLSRFSISVKVLCVNQILDLWHPWRGHAALEHHFEVDATEPFVLLDLISSVVLVSQSQLTVSAQERLHKVSGLGLNVGRELIVSIHDLLVDAERVVIIEGWVASKHLKNKDTQGPPVYVLVVAF